MPLSNIAPKMVVRFTKRGVMYFVVDDPDASRIRDGLAAVEREKNKTQDQVSLDLVCELRS